LHRYTEALLPMLSKALDKVPAAHRGGTPLYVWATAGMRVLKDHQQDHLWAAVTRVTQRHTAFRLSSGKLAEGSAHFRTITGEEEGFFAWLAANYLSGVDLTRIGGAAQVECS
jgi:Golgi nucleoside diphosphatase